jgi:hypothetical protein
MHTQAKGGTDWYRVAAVKGGKRTSMRGSTDFKERRDWKKLRESQGRLVASL